MKNNCNMSSHNEYVHIYRYDTVTKLIATLALCIHWFNPLCVGDVYSF